MRRVVVTGYGAVTPLGLSAEETWRAAVEGQSGVSPITRFDTTDFPVKLAAEVKGFDPEKVLDRREVRRQDRFEHYAHAAAIEALHHSGLEITEANSIRIGTVMGTGVGGLETMIEQILATHEEGPRRLSPFTIPRIMSNGAPGTISIAHGIRGPSFCVTSACASSSDAIGMAVLLIRAGVIDAALVGGTEAGITSFGIAAFERIGAYSPRTEHTPSPFSADRDGLIMGEGAAVLVIEALEHAKARRATILAELLGYGASADAYHITAPTEDGSGSALAIRAALDDAHLNAEDVDYINAHGTGTPLNDVSETRAVKLALGEHARRVAISSTKSMTGHMMGATGALEAVFCVQAIRDQVAPPTINYTAPDAECDLDYVPNEARQMPIRVAMSNAFGFGGHNSVLIFGQFKG